MNREFENFLDIISERWGNWNSHTFDSFQGVMHLSDIVDYCEESGITISEYAPTVKTSRGEMPTSAPQIRTFKIIDGETIMGVGQTLLESLAHFRYQELNHAKDKTGGSSS